jgi:hypothetical protein
MNKQGQRTAREHFRLLYTVSRPNSWPNWSSISWPCKRLKRLLALIIASCLHFSETHILTVSSILPA